MSFSTVAPDYLSTSLIINSDLCVKYFSAGFILNVARVFIISNLK